MLLVKETQIFFAITGNIISLSDSVGEKKLGSHIIPDTVITPCERKNQIYLYKQTLEKTDDLFNIKTRWKHLIKQCQAY